MADGQTQLPEHDTVAMPSMYVPVGHLQSDTVLLPASELDPGGQLLQAPAPAVSLNLPASHARHGPPLGPPNPALHTQSEAASLPASEEVPTMMPSRQLAVRDARWFGLAREWDSCGT